MLLGLRSWKSVGDETLTKFQSYEVQKDWKEQLDLAAAMPDKTNEMRKRLLELWTAIEQEGPSQWWMNERQPPSRGGNEAVR